MATSDGQEPLFRGRRPRALTFGTSGLRGLVEDITDLEAYINTAGFLAYLAQGEGGAVGGQVALAGDLRPSTHSDQRSILQAVARAVVDAGQEPAYLGRIPTPALTAHGRAHAVPSIMVTGSHIPFDRNGIKFNTRHGEILKSDEPAILASVQQVRSELYGQSAEASLFDDTGMFRPDVSAPLPELDDTARNAYIQRYLKFFPADALAGLKLVFYQHSAVGRDLVPEILTALGARVFTAGRSESFVPVDTEAIARPQLQTLQQMVDQGRAETGHVDAILSTDGDSDRPLIAGVQGDGSVRFFPGDAVGILVTSYLEADAAVVPVSATDAVEIHLGEGVQVERTRIGSPWVIAGMQSTTGKRCVGWEANGGYLTGTDIEKDGRMLPALPTRDAVLPMLCLLHAAAAQRLSLVELFDALPGRFSHAGLIDTPDAQVGRRLLTRFSPGPDVRQVKYGDEIHAVDTAGGRQDLGDDARHHLAGLRDRLAEVFSAAQGYGAVVQIDFLDGIRMSFAGGEIAHIRPSGNAPQLRLYAVADTPERAADMVRQATAAPDGLLHQMVSRYGAGNQS